MTDDFFSRLDKESETTVYEGQSSAELFQELTRTIAVAHAKKDFLEGRLPVDSFLDFLDQQGFDVYVLAKSCHNPPPLC